VAIGLAVKAVIQAAGWTRAAYESGRSTYDLGQSWLPKLAVFSAGSSWPACSCEEDGLVGSIRGLGGLVLVAVLGLCSGLVDRQAQQCRAQLVEIWLRVHESVGPIVLAGSHELLQANVPAGTSKRLCSLRHCTDAHDIGWAA
jgi:hypothetical protein